MFSGPVTLSLYFASRPGSIYTTVQEKSRSKTGTHPHRASTLKMPGRTDANSGRKRLSNLLMRVLTSSLSSLSSKLNVLKKIIASGPATCKRVLLCSYFASVPSQLCILYILSRCFQLFQVWLNFQQHGVVLEAAELACSLHVARCLSARLELILTLYVHV